LENSYQKFAKDVGIIGVTNLLVSLSSLILLPLFTKNLGAANYGIWIQSQFTISLVCLFSGLGLPYAMTRFLPALSDKRRIQSEYYSVLVFVFLINLVISSLIFIFAGPIAEAFFGGATSVVRIVGFTILVSSLNAVCLGLFRSFRRMKTYSIFTIVNTYGQIGLSVYLVLNGYGLLSIFIAGLVISVISFLVLSLLIKSWIGLDRPSFSRIREYLNFSLPTILGNFSSWVVTSSDRYFIGYFLGTALVGAYSASYSLGTTPLVVVGILGFVLPPTLSKLYDEGRMDEVKIHLSYSLKYSLALAIPFVFGAAILAHPVLRLFTTAEISAQSFHVLPVVALSILINIFGSTISYILILVKKPGIIGITWTMAAVVNLGLNILAVPRIGIMGAAFSTLIAYSLATGFQLYYSFKEFRFSIDWRFIAKSVVASGLMSAVIWWMAPQSNSVTIMTIATGGAVYAVSLLLLRGFNKEEMEFFGNIFKRV